MTYQNVDQTRSRERAISTQFRLLICTLGASLLAVSVLAGDPTLGQTKGPKRPPAKPKQSAEKGHAQFAKTCAACHGPNGKGGEGPNLHGLKLTDQAITKTIKEGIKSEMPAFGTRFKDAELKDLIAYLRSLR